MEGTMLARGTKCWNQMNRNNKGRFTRAICWLHLLSTSLTGVTQSRLEGPASQKVPVHAEKTPSFAKSQKNGPHSPGLRGTTCVLWPQGRQPVPAPAVASFVASFSPSSREAFAASGTFISLFEGSSPTWLRAKYRVRLPVFLVNGHKTRVSAASKQKTHVAVPLSPCGWC